MKRDIIINNQKYNIYINCFNLINKKEISKKDMPLPDNFDNEIEQFINFFNIVLTKKRKYMKFREKIDKKRYAETSFFTGNVGFRKKIYLNSYHNILNRFLNYCITFEVQRFFKYDNMTPYLIINTKTELKNELSMTEYFKLSQKIYNNKNNNINNINDELNSIRNENFSELLKITLKMKKYLLDNI